MPTVSHRAVTRAAELVRAALAEAGPGGVIEYSALAEALRVELCATEAAARNRRHLRALRRAVQVLRGEGACELFGRSLRDGRWVVTHVRAPGCSWPPPVPKARAKWKPARPYEGRFRVAPELLARVEEAVLSLLSGPIDEADHLLASAFVPPPAPRWVSYAWLTSRASFRLQGGINHATRHNVIGFAVRSLERKGPIRLRKQEMRNGKSRVRWARLARPAASPVTLASPLIAPRVAAEASKT